jgi:hypothetical protein
MRRSASALVLLLLAGCAAAPPPAAQTPGAQTSPAPRQTSAAAGDAQPRAGLPVAPPGVPGAPSSCEPFKIAAATGGSCASPQQALELLDKALAKTDAAERDRELSSAESCAGFPAGIVRALRAELAPAECGDVIVEGYLRERGDTLTADVRHVLVGLGLSARLSRLVRQPPKFSPPYTKPRFSEFFRDTLARWIQTEAHAIHQTSLAGARLLDYGKGIVAIEAGLADMRFVEVVRQVPLPQELASDAELKDAYFGALDQALEPRKDRGRDATLVGLRQLAKVGVIHDERVDRARTLLSELYGGSRVDALDGLLLPPLAAFESMTPEERVAARLPTYYAGELLGDAAAGDARRLRALLEQGLPDRVRTKLAAATSPELRQLHARGLFALAQRYWRADDFARSGEIAQSLLQDPTYGDEARLIVALTQTLSRGPKDAAELMLRGPMLPETIGNVAALDALVKARSRFAGMAAFDAGYVMSLIPSAKADAQYWRGAAERFRRAAALLQEPKHKAVALERAKAAEQTALAIK